jgi:hypothetical protein
MHTAPQRKPAPSIRSRAACLAFALFAAAAPAWAVQAAGAPGFPALATPQAQAVIGINDLEGPAIFAVDPGSSLNASVSGASGFGVVDLDMATGLLRSRSQGSFGFQNSLAGWDFLRFDGSASISYALDVDGVLSNLRPNGFVYADIGFRLYDVTDWSSYFRELGGIRFVSRNGNASPFPSIVASSFERVGVRGAGATSCQDIAVTGACITSSNGSLQSVEFSLAGNASVQAGELYLVELVLNLSTLNGAGSSLLQTADFSNTAAFSFTDLGGLTVTSSSGLFLSAVPEPQTWALWAAGLLGIAVLARRRDRSASGLGSRRLAASR